jgi:hypothetical protein
MKIQPLPTSQRTKIDVYRSSESIPTREAFLLHALDIPEGIADVLKIESYTALQ